MLFQEVGFDIVSIWNLIPWLVKAAIFLLAVGIVYVLTRVLSSASRRASRP